MGGRVERGGVFPEERLGAIAMVNVDIHHGHALGAVFRLHIFTGFQDRKVGIGGGCGGGVRGGVLNCHVRPYSYVYDHKPSHSYNASALRVFGGGEEEILVGSKRQATALTNKSPRPAYHLRSSSKRRWGSEGGNFRQLEART